MKKVGKQRLPIPENPAYCRLLYSINSQRLIAQEISNKIGIDQSAVIRNLKVLLDNGYLKIHLEGKRKQYLIDWERISKSFIDYLIERAKEFDAYMKDWSKGSAMAKTNIGHEIAIQYKNKQMPFQQLFNPGVVSRLISNPFLQDYLRQMLESLDRQGQKKNWVYDIPLTNLYYYIGQRVILVSPQMLHYFSNVNNERKQRDPAELVLFNPLDRMESLKREHLGNRSYRGIKLNPVERRYLADMVVLLPHILDEINKDRVFETAFIESRASIDKLRKRGDLLMKDKFKNVIPNQNKPK